MATTLDPKKLDFGALAAEREHETLKSYFVESTSYKNLLGGEKWVALGNRGSGKSAIMKMIAEYERTQGTLVIELTPEDYSYELLSRTMLPEQRGSWAKQGAYTAAWKYLLYVTVMKKITATGAKWKTGGAAAIYSYLRDNHKGADANPIGLLVSYLKRLEGVKVGSWELGLKSRNLTQLYHLEEIVALLPALDEMCKRRKVIVLVDELDKGWDNSEDARSFVAGLFQAAVGISSNTPNVRIRISLRRELYQSIPALYDDTQKWRDIIEIIEWDEEQLLDMIARRIYHSFPELGLIPSEERWTRVFAEVLTYRKNKSFNYMVDRTLYRPRQLIQFCTQAVETLRGARGDFPMNYDVVSVAELPYSEEMVKDVDAEYRFQYPGLLSVFETFRGMVYALERTQLDEHCLRLSLGDLHVDKEALWCREQEPHVIIEALYQVGFLQALAVGGLKARRRSGSEYVGAHQVSTVSLTNVARFHIHPMFRSFLACKEPKESKDRRVS